MSAINLDPIIRFMKENPPLARIDSEKVASLQQVDEIIIENAKILLAYQAEMKGRTSKELLGQRHLKYRSQLLTQSLDSKETS